MKIAFFSTKNYDKKSFEERNVLFGHELVYFETSLNEKTVPLVEGFNAICVFVNDKLDKTVIEALGRMGVELIALRCAGFNNVDIEAVSHFDMKVMRVPAYSPHAVAEHAVALIMTLNRKTHKAFNRIREGNFSLERLMGFDMYGKTVGVVGTGKIGGIFAGILQGFGCKVIAYDKYESKDLIEKGVEYKSLEDVFKESDIISLHSPLTPETHHMINKKSLSMMKDGVMLINTSRGKLIDTEDAIEALKIGKLGYLGIDVYEQEEKLFFRDLSELIIRDDKIARLISFPNVLVTAHQAFFTETALQQIATVTLQNISDFEKGIFTPNEVSLEMVI